MFDAKDIWRLAICLSRHIDHEVDRVARPLVSSSLTPDGIVAAGYFPFDKFMEVLRARTFLNQIPLVIWSEKYIMGHIKDPVNSVFNKTPALASNSFQFAVLKRSPYSSSVHNVSPVPLDNMPRFYEYKDSEENIDEEKMDVVHVLEREGGGRRKRARGTTPVMDFVLPRRDAEELKVVEIKVVDDDDFAWYRKRTNLHEVPRAALPTPKERKPRKPRKPRNEDGDDDDPSVEFVNKKKRKKKVTTVVDLDAGGDDRGAGGKKAAAATTTKKKRKEYPKPTAMEGVARTEW
jgi:hypothetical protein